MNLISSLDEAWLHTLDQCVGDSPIDEVILPLMRDCFLAERCTPFYCCRRVTATGSLPTLRATLRKSRSYHGNSQQSDESETTGAQP